MWENAKNEILNNWRKHLWEIISLLVFVIFITGYFLGYRFKDNFTIGKIGFVSIDIPLTQTSVFIDEREKAKTEKDGEDVKVSLSPREHSIIVSHPGYFPWTKKFRVQSSETTNLSPILIPTNASGQIITKEDPEYWSLWSKITYNKLPVKDSPQISEDKSAKIWVEENTIIHETGSTTISILKPISDIKNISFYKNRSDGVIFSTSDSVYMIEADKTNTQNFMPIYRGQSPAFIKTAPDFIYILDGETLMQVVI